MEFPEKIIVFLKEVSSFDIGYGGFTFFAPENLEKEQIGYGLDEKRNPVSSSSDGAWQKNWIVIGIDDLVGDPVLVDVATPDFTIMTAEHGTGAWHPYPIADSLQKFQAIIHALTTLSANRDTPEAFSKNPIPKKEKEDFFLNVTTGNPDAEIEYWEGFLDLE